jgi:hypothetical protein
MWLEIVKRAHNDGGSRTACGSRNPSRSESKGEVMITVKITQFIAPHGEQRERSCEVPDDCAVGYEALKRHGCRLTAEILTMGMVSQCVEHEEGDFLIEITPNGPQVQEALVKMLREFDGAKFTEWLAEVNA